MKNRAHINWLIIGSLLLLMGCGDSKEVNTKDEARSAKIASAAQVSEVEHYDKVTSYGRIKKNEDYIISFLTEGTIEYLNVTKGNKVRIGQQIGQLKHDHLESDYVKVSLAQQQNQVVISELTNQLKEAEKRLAENEMLLADSLTNLEMVIQNRLEVETLKNEIEKSRIGLDISEKDRTSLDYHQSRHMLISPINGTVQRIIHKAGENVSAGMGVVVITPDQTSSIFESAVSDKEIVKLTHLGSAEINLDAFDGVAIDGRVSYISAVPDPSTGQYPIEIVLADNEKELVPGLFGEVSITSDATVIYQSIPLSALTNAVGEDGKVLIVRDSKAMQRDIKIKDILHEQVLVADGLDDVRLVLTDVNGLVLHGDSIVISKVR